MAKNIFVHGDFKKLREAASQYKKDEQTLAINLFNFKSREKSFQNTDWAIEDRSSFIQEKYSLLKLKFSLDSEQLRLHNLKLSLVMPFCAMKMLSNLSLALVVTI